MRIFRHGLRNILRNPLRLVLVVLLLGTSLMFVAAMFALNGNLQERINAIHNQLGTGITISPPGQQFTTEQIATAEHMPGVISYTERIMAFKGNCVSTQLISLPLPAPADSKSGVGRGSTDIASGDTSEWLTCYGYTPGAVLELRLGIATIVAGHSFTASQHNDSVVLTSSRLAQVNHLHLGSTLQIHGTSFTIIGFYTTGSLIGDNSVIFPIHTAQRVLQQNITSLTLYVADHSQIPTLEQNLSQQLGAGAQITTSEEQFGQSTATLTALQQLCISVLIIALLGATLIILCTVALTVRERSREIGILKSLGASHWQVIGQYGVEILSLSLLAAALAIALLGLVGPTIGLVATTVLPADTTQAVRSSTVASSVLPSLTVTLSFQVVLFILGVGILLALLASTISAWYTVRLQVARVLWVK